VTEVVAGMSLPEVLLVLREDSRREAGRALVALQTQTLAAFAVWDKDAGRRLEKLQKVLSEPLAPKRPASDDQLEAVFDVWGIDTKCE
jgi:hypothetical protein